jgi:glycosyltransferase involved in cell wall biosynthesis
MMPLYVDQELFRVFRLSKANGIIGITTMWKELADSHKLPFIHIPATCWPSSADAPDSSPVTPSARVGDFHVLYVGMLFSRDLPTEMMKGFELALEMGIQAKMTIVGGTDYCRSAKQTVRFVRGNPRLRDNVILTGYIPESDPLYWQTLKGADAYVLMRADTRESRACFPTRIPPYMCTGKPLITSKVGDIGRVLTDRVDACLLRLDDQSKALFEAIHFLATNPEAAQKTGKAGREKAFKEFSCVDHGFRLNEFLSAISPG